MPVFKSTRFRSAAFVLSVAAISAGAQTHFTFTSPTGNNMTVLVQTAINPTVNGQPLAPGDEIGVFTPAGLCIGARVWDGVQNRSIAVWGDNDMTPIVDGAKAGETLLYRIWDFSLAQEAVATVTYDTLPPATNRGTYAVDGIAILASLSALLLPSTSLILDPVDSAIIVVDSVRLAWNRAAPAVDRYLVEVATDSAMTTLVVNDSSWTDTTRLLTSLVNNTTYYWRVKAHNSAGWGDYSAETRFVTSFVGVLFGGNILRAFSLKYSSGMLRYTLPDRCYVSVRYYDIRGRLVGSFVNSTKGSGDHSLPLQLSSWAMGAYIQVFTAGEIVRKDRITVIK